MATDVNSGNYEQEVIQSDKPVLVDFWGPRCGPCLALSPQVDRLEESYRDRLKVTKLDASKNRRLCLDLRVAGLPTFLFYRDGKEVDRLTGGDLRIDDIEEAVKRVLG